MDAIVGRHADLGAIARFIESVTRGPSHSRWGASGVSARRLYGQRRLEWLPTSHTRPGWILAVPTDK